MLTTDGHLLGGRVLYRQPAGGFRSGIEPVLLAASVPVRPGEQVLEAGTGCGASLLCLTARVPGIRATGVEIDPDLAELAAANASANGYHGIEVIAEPIETAVLDRRFDHAIANPPYHTGGTASPDATRERAKRGDAALLDRWIERLSASLRDRGGLTLIVPSGMIPVCIAAMAGHACPCSAIFPIWPKSGRPSKLVLLRGVRLGRAPMRLLPGLVLHDPDGTFTGASQSILRDGAALNLDEV